MAEIVKQLNLNRHPRDCNDYSLIEASNVRLTHDKHSITSEEGIEENGVITYAIKQVFSTYEIVGIIDSPKDLILFVYGTPVGEGITYKDSAIFRYKAAPDSCELVTQKWQWQGGKIKGTYTYNIDNNLIIAVAEHDFLHYEQREDFAYNGEVPLKIINIDDADSAVYKKSWETYAAVPKVPYCYCNSFDYVNGFSYKGYYEFYIRYKISENNYTQWYYINGKPLVDKAGIKDIMTYVRQDIVKQVIDTAEADPSVDMSQVVEHYENFTDGHYDFVTDDREFVDITLKAILYFQNSHNNTMNYYEYQLGYIVQSKDYTKAFRTDDMPFTGAPKVYVVNPKVEVEYSSEEFVNIHTNYYNVKQITNYQNRIYIANYKEKTLNRTFDIRDYIKLSLRDYNVGVDSGGNIRDDILRTVLIPGEIYDFYVHFVDAYGFVSAGTKLSVETHGIGFEIYTNADGEKFFKVPIVTGSDDNVFGTKILDLTYTSSLPNGFCAAFISYRKFQKTNKLNGFIYDGVNEGPYTGSKFTNGPINYDDKVDVGVDYGRGMYSTDGSSFDHIYGLYVRDSNRSVNRNNTTFYGGRTLLLGDPTPTSIDIRVANAGKDNNAGRESYLWAKNLINVQHTPLFQTLYRNLTAQANLYSGEDKVLIPTSLIYTGGTTHDNQTGYNGFLAYDSVIIYGNEGFTLNTVDGNIYNTIGNRIITKGEALQPYQCYIFSYIWDYPLHIRRIKNAPKVSMFVPETGDNKTVFKHIVQTLVEPKDSIDLFEYPHPNKSEIGSYKLFEMYDNKISNITTYEKTIRRSNVIQDESKEIGWRTFPLEGYKNIIENKGRITNLFSLGTNLFVHTEFSLFVFEIDNTMRTVDEKVLLYQPDIFEAQYKEVFTTEQGYGGLQDDLAYCIGEFGYIFYDNEHARLYRLDEANLIPMDNAIINWITSVRPWDARFAFDRNNQRILIRFNEIDDKALTLSYDYSLNSFISWHDYDFNESANTYSRVFLLYNDRTKIGNYANGYVNRGKYDNYVDGKYTKADYDSINNVSSFSITIIVNSVYEAIKMLEFIKYDCRKIINSFPVEEDSTTERSFPYSGSSLRIYNEDCDTNEMDISVELDNPKYNRFNNYKKPWYELTKWNYNYFRDKIPTHPATNISDKLRRIHGNHFAFNFKFTNNDTNNLRFEFESLECQFTNNR